MGKIKSQGNLEFTRKKKDAYSMLQSELAGGDVVVDVDEDE